MYNASAEFHSAVFESPPTTRVSPATRVLLRFADNMILTNEDIHITSGLKFSETVNFEEELTVGACPASTMDGVIMNYHGLLSGYEFGECSALLGVRTAITTYLTNDANVTAILDYGETEVMFTGHVDAPYLRINLTEIPAAQPPFAVRAILLVGVTLYAVSEEGEYWAAAYSDGELVPLMEGETWDDLSVYTWEELEGRTWASFQGVTDLNDFMVNKIKGWASARRGLVYNGNVLHEFYADGTVEKYEYIPLGVFIIQKPEKRKVKLISISAMDRMSKFDIVADAFWNSLAYPITLGEIFAELCAHVEVPQATTTFINSTREFTKAPMQAENITCREILRWIAEAACTYARMTRDGEVELVWFGAEAISIPMNQYFSISVAEYVVAQIDKLQVMNSQSDIGAIIGDGVNGYQIMDNPCLYGATDTEIRTYATPIYNRLSAYKAFSPISANAVCNWAIQAGDIISIVLDETEYMMPIYRQTITWNGAVRVTYENTGAEKRPVVNATNRRIFAQNRSMHEIAVTVNGFESRITDAEGDVAELKLTTDGLDLALTNNKLTFDATGLTVYSSGIRIKNGIGQSVFYADANGNLTLNAVVNAVGGTIGGWTITSTNLNYNSNTMFIAPAGQDGYFSGQYYVGLAMQIGSQFAVDVGGNVYASRINFSNSASIYSYYDLPYYLTILAGNLSLDSAYTQIGSAIGAFTVQDSAVSTSNYTEFSLGYLSGLSSGTVLYCGVGGFVGYLTSSIRFKKNVQTMGQTYIDALEALRPVTFDWIENGEHDIGFIAEEAIHAVPEVVALEEVNGLKVPLTVHYERITPLLVHYVQHLKREINSLKEAVYGSI